MNSTAVSDHLTAEIEKARTEEARARAARLRLERAARLIGVPSRKRQPSGRRASQATADRRAALEKIVRREGPQSATHLWKRMKAEFSRSIKRWDVANDLSCDSRFVRVSHGVYGIAG